MTHAPLILDLAGPRLAAHERRRLMHPLVGGLILFTRNWQDRRQLLRLVAELKDLRPDLLVCIDHEGGRVQRLRGDGFTDLPAMAELGERWMHDAPGAPGSGALRALEAATACGQVLAAELRACGVDLSFAPVLDLDHGRNAAIGRRALHRDPRVVALLARALMFGLLQAGMANCGKHFPGHGWAQADTHVAIASDERTLEQLLADDAQPYAHLGSALRAVMPAHVIYPQVDALPAGFSSRWLGEILRGRLGFEGAIFSDDLGMAAARRLPDPAGGPDRELSFTEAALHALQAGCDLVLACNQSAQKKGAVLDALLDGLAEAADAGRWSPDPDSEARRLALLPISPPLAWDELMHDPAYLRAQEILHTELGGEPRG